jgi:hypothetical protein
VKFDVPTPSQNIIYSDHIVENRIQSLHQNFITLLNHFVENMIKKKLNLTFGEVILLTDFRMITWSKLSMADYLRIKGS